MDENTKKYNWRPVRGEILRNDQSLAGPADIEEFFAEEGVVARGEHEGALFRFEIAVVGRRRRVATIKRSDDGKEFIGPGRHLTDFLERAYATLRKVRVEADNEVLGDTIDLGEVPITEDDFAYADADVAADGGVAAGDGAATDLGLEGAPISGEHEGEAGLPEGEVENLLADDEGKIPTLNDGPMLVVSDVPFARVPGLAARINAPVAVMPAEDGANAMVADVPLTKAAKIGSQPGFVLVLSVDLSGERNPVLVIRQDSGIASWKWIDTLSDMSHTEASEAASQFARRELGSGARAARIINDFPSVDPGDLLDALNAPAEEGVAKFVEAIHLPHEVSDTLAGLLEARRIPEATVFEPEAFRKRFQSSMAYEVSGQGRAPAEFWEFYRKIYLRHPRALGVGATVQAGIGTALGVAGVRLWNKRGGKLLTAVGAGLAVNAAIRILTTQWIQVALERAGLAERLRMAAEEEMASQAAEADEAEAAPGKEKTGSEPATENNEPGE